MLRSLNWSAIVLGAGAGLVAGLLLAAIAGGADASTAVLVAVQLLSFVLAGFLAGWFSLVSRAAAGGFSGLILYFGLAIASILSGGDLQGVALVFFGVMALALGSLGGLLAGAARGRRADDR